MSKEMKQGIHPPDADARVQYQTVKLPIVKPPKDNQPHSAIDRQRQKQPVGSMPKAESMPMAASSPAPVTKAASMPMTEHEQKFVRTDHPLTDMKIVSSVYGQHTEGDEFAYARLSKNGKRDLKFSTFRFEIMTEPAVDSLVKATLAITWTTTRQKPWLLWGTWQKPMSGEQTIAYIPVTHGRAMIHVRTHWACQITICCECGGMRRFKTVTVRSPGATAHVENEKTGAADAMLELLSSSSNQRE